MSHYICLFNVYLVFLIWKHVLFDINTEFFVIYLLYISIIILWSHLLSRVSLIVHSRDYSWWAQKKTYWAPKLKCWSAVCKICTLSAVWLLWPPLFVVCMFSVFKIFFIDLILLFIFLFKYIFVFFTQNLSSQVRESLVGRKFELHGNHLEHHKE